MVSLVPKGLITINISCFPKIESLKDTTVDRTSTANYFGPFLRDTPSKGWEGRRGRFFDIIFKEPFRFYYRRNQRLELEWRREWALYLHLPPFFSCSERRNTFWTVAVNRNSAPRSIQSRRDLFDFGFRSRERGERICAPAGTQVLLGAWRIHSQEDYQLRVDLG